MKITMESIKQMTAVNGQLCRVWKGVTEGGVPCFVFTKLLKVAGAENQAEFERELEATLPPPEEAKVIPLRMVL
jgi:hypothetical protein